MAGFVIALVLLGLSSYWLTCMFPLRERASFVLACLVLAYAQIVLSAEVLSELEAIGPGGFLAIQTLITAAAGVIWFYSGRPKPEFPAFPGREECKRLANDHKMLVILGISVIIFALVGAALILYVPPNTWDALSYRLSRAVYWLKQGSLRHYQAANPRQIIFPPNAAIVLLWMMTFLRSDVLAGFLQWTAYWGILVCIYALARQMEFSVPQAIFAGLVTALLPLMVLQSTSTQTDQVVGFCLAAGLYFFMRGIQGRERSILLLSGIAFGLGLGTKSSAWLFLPGLGLGAAVFSWKEGGKDWLSSFSFWVMCFLAGFALFGAYNYILNLEHFGKPFGSAGQLKYNVLQFSFRGFWANIGRQIYNFLDVTCFPKIISSKLTELKVDLFLPVLSFIGFPLNDPGSLPLTGPSFSELFLRYHLFDEFTARFGPLGFFLFLPVVVWQAFRFKEFNPGRWTAAAVSLGFLLTFCAVLRWQLRGGRYLINMLVCGAPLLAIIYPREEVQNTLILGAKVRHYVLWGVVALSVALGFWATFHNENKLILGWQTVLGKDPIARRCLKRKEMEWIIKYVEEHVPRDAVLGLMIGSGIRSNEWDYPFFGEGLTRRLVPMEHEPITDGILRHYGLDFILIKGNLTDYSNNLLKVNNIIPGWFLVSAV